MEAKAFLRIKWSLISVDFRHLFLLQHKKQEDEQWACLGELVNCQEQ